MTALPREAAPKKSATFGDRSEGRVNNFDALRLILSVAVLYSHCFPLLYGYNSRDQFHRLSHGQFMDSGELSVNFFFVISGFLITASWARSKNAVDYLRKRALRIFPGLLAALLFCIVVIGPLSGVALGEYFRSPDTYRFLSTGLMRQIRPGMPGVFPHNPFPDVVNGSTWSIRYEFICYLLVMVFGWAALFRYRAGTVAVFALSLLAYRLDWTHSARILWFGDVKEMPRLLAYFMAGAVFYLYRSRIPYSPVLFGLSLLALVATLKSHLWLTMPIFGTYVLFSLAFCPSRFQHIGRKCDLSYGIYLYAFPVTQLLALHFGPRLNPYTMFALVLPLSIGLALLSWRFVEEPFLRRKAKRPDAVSTSPVAVGQIPGTGEAIPHRVIEATASQPLSP